MRITPDSHPDAVGRVRVLVDGKDVTNDCVMADDEEGMAEVLCRDSEHHKALIGENPHHLAPSFDKVCSHVVEGSVVIEMQGERLDRFSRDA